MNARRSEPEGDDVPTTPAQRQRVLDELGLMTEHELALLYDCEVSTMKNRPRAELPPFFRAGGKRLFFRADVIEFFRRRTTD